MSTYSVYNIKIDNNLSIADGLSSTPSISFASASNTGIHRNTSGDLAFIRAGVTIAYARTNQFVVRGGSVAVPSLTFDTRSTTGLFSQSDLSMGVVSGGATSAVFNSSGLVLPQLSNTLLGVNSLGQVIATSSTGGSQTLAQTLALGNNAGTYSMILATGSGTNTSLRFGNMSANSGIANPFGNEMAFYSGGGIPLYLSSNRLLASKGSAAAASPNISFQGDLDTGIYSPSADVIGVSTGGATAAVFNSSGLVLPQLSNTLLGVNSLGQVIATSSTGGSQTLAQTLALGNDVGGNSIIATSGSISLENQPNNSYIRIGEFDRFTTITQGLQGTSGRANIILDGGSQTASIASEIGLTAETIEIRASYRPSAGIPETFSNITMASQSVAIACNNGFPYLNMVIASASTFSMDEINLGAYVSISDGASILSGTLQIQGITSSLLATDTNGYIIGTSSTGGSSGTSGTSGVNGATGPAGSSGYVATIQTTTASNTTIASISFGTYSVYSVSADIIGHDFTNKLSYGAKAFGVFENNGTTYSLINTTDITEKTTFAIATSDIILGTSSMSIVVSGESGKTINWKADYTYMMY